MQPEIAFSAADTAEDVQRCIAVLLSTRAGSVAMDREFGLSWDFVDLPVETELTIHGNEIGRAHV